jgi:VCBS repeat-containing protein
MLDVCLFATLHMLFYSSCRTKYASQKGRVSIALDGKWGYPKDPKNPAGEQLVNNSTQ